jgi:membrane protease YdiL (CAAX protease family)
VVLWIVLDRSAALLGSTRGEWGLIVCALVVVCAIAMEGVLSGRAPRAALLALGLRMPRLRALGWTLALCAALLAFFPLFSAVTGSPLALRADAAILAAGMFAQGGIAEETVFRGFLFRRLREQRTFWRAAIASAVPFVAVHLPLLGSLGITVGLASIVVAVSLSFPLAWLFDRSGASIWPSSIVHAVVQASIKLVDAGDAFMPLALAWMGLTAIAPWAFFFLLRDEPGATSTGARTTSAV